MYECHEQNRSSEVCTESSSPTSSSLDCLSLIVESISKPQPQQSDRTSLAENSTTNTDNTSAGVQLHS